MAKINKYDKQHIRNLSAYERQIDEIYKEAVKEAAALGISIRDFNPDKLFSFDDYPATRKRIDKLLSGLKSDLTAVIVNGVRSEWTLANNKNNELARLVFGDNVGKLTQEQYRRYFSTNGKALDAFLSRKASGLNLSDRVWKYTDQFKAEIELGLDVGIRNGLSADEMSRELRDYLRHTDKLFRRVRDEHGMLQLSKRAAAFHPGQGVYRSSYKNARRLAATETNMAYRASDYERWQQFDFVVGIEIKLSNNHTLNGHPFHDICDELQGKYPKDFKFTGWHPHCRCHAVTILKTEEELMADNQRIMEGKEPGGNSQNSIAGVPDNFKKWITDNETRIVKANEKDSLPYFLKENRSAWRDYTSIELINQQTVQKTTRYESLLNAESTKLAKEMGVLVTPVNVKSERRIFEKAINDYDGDIAKVCDIIRNTFIAPADKIQSLISGIQKKFNIIEYNQQSTQMGYTGHLLKIWVRDGVKGEIQVNTPQMIYAKESAAKKMLGADLFNKIKKESGLPHGLGHKYYEEYRILTAAERHSAKGRELSEKSKAYYERIKSIKL